MADEKQTEEFVQKFGPKSPSHSEDSDRELAQAMSDPNLKIKPVPEDFVPGGPDSTAEKSNPPKKEQHGKSHGHAGAASPIGFTGTAKRSS